MNSDVNLLLRGPDGLEGLRKEVMGQMSLLLENQTRTNIFAATINELISKVHGEILSDLVTGSFAEDSGSTAIQRVMDLCLKLDRSLNVLFVERQRQMQQNVEYLKEILKDFSQTINYLSSTIVDRDLFERQSHVLEQIVLSHERVANWKEFVQEILLGFHAIFPFNVFFIAFSEDHGLGLYIYYFGEYDDELKLRIKNKLSRDLLTHLQMDAEIPLEIEEYHVPGIEESVEIEDIQMISVAVPDHSPKLAGLLGLAFASVQVLSNQERSIIRSLLSVMVMIVGSSKQLSRTLKELEYYSGHDPLTGLYNRRFFTEMLDYEVGRAERHQHEFCILLLDLDNFKDINDSYGHPAGDSTLVLIAESVRTFLRKGDIATRIGGDEFAVILPETPLVDAHKVADALREKLHEITFTAPDGKTFRVTTSIGLVAFPKDGNTPADLMAGVDIALYHAKDLGKNEVSTLDKADLHLKQTRGSRIYAEELREALSLDYVRPYYQPIINCRTGVVFANEALARLTKADGTLVVADKFIETMEKYGLARDMDKIILTKALTASKEHLLATGKLAKVFINLAPQEIRGRGILAFAEDLCTELSLPPGCVVFEILERDAIGDMTHMGKFLSNLRDKGFAFALDDFGSGYNSFHYLRELHFEYVKIDGAFVRNIVASNIDRALVRNLSHLCQDLGIQTVAEFVESEETLLMLQDMGIDYAQGYAIAKPTANLSFESFTSDNSLLGMPR